MGELKFVKAGCGYTAGYGEELKCSSTLVVENGGDRTPLCLFHEVGGWDEPWMVEPLFWTPSGLLISMEMYGEWTLEGQMMV